MSVGTELLIGLDLLNARIWWVCKMLAATIIVVVI